MSNETQGKCPVMHGAVATNSSENSTSVRDWWPNNLNLKYSCINMIVSLIQWKMDLIIKKSFQSLTMML